MDLTQEVTVFKLQELT